MTDLTDDSSVPQWLARAKLDAPRHPVRLVDRQHLLDQLDQFLNRRLGLVVAPAGFGKTTVMLQWRERLKSAGTTVAWLSLDEADAEPLQFISYIIFSLSEAGVDLGWLLPLAEQGLNDSALRPAVSGLLETLAKHRGPTVLVLDDFHRLNSSYVERVLSSIIGAAPHNFTIVVTSRTKPHLDVSRLLAAGVAVELDAECLRITRQELGHALDRPLNPDELDLVFERTEGWPVALQLVRLLLHSDGSSLTLIEQFKGDSGHIAAYLADQVLVSLTDQQRAFLLQTSILERFNAALADAVTGRKDSLDTLAHLDNLKALLVPLSEPSGWFRYHHLFAQYLRDQLRRRQNLDIDELHASASIWFEQNGDLAAAVRHAREAQNFSRCAFLIEQAGGWELILFGGIGYLRNLLRNIPESMLPDYPRVQVAKAYLDLKDGRIGEARVHYELAKIYNKNTLPGAKLARDLLNVGARLDMYEDQPMRVADFNRLKETFAKLPASDPLSIATLTCPQILGAMAIGRIAEAEFMAQDAMRIMRRARTVLGLNYCFLHAGLAALYQGRFQVAKTHFGAAQRMAADNFSSDPGLKALADYLFAVLNHWRGQLNPQQKAEFLAAAEYIESYDGWFELYANGLEVECALDASPGLAITRARRIASERGLERLELLADAQSLRYGTTSGDEALAHRIKVALPDGVWRHDPFMWRPFVESRLALARHFSGRDRAAAIQALDEAMECCRQTGAVIYLIDGLAARAVVLDRSGDRSGALSDIIEALSMAAPERISRPFKRSREVIPLLRAVIKTSRSDYVELPVKSFASALLASSSSSCEVTLVTQFSLSRREQEVLEELAKGRSNKEIARALDMTAHTVKFHLKNIFTKLKVERRTEAIALARVNLAS